MSELAKLDALVRWLHYGSRIAEDVAIYRSNNVRPLTFMRVDALNGAEARIGSAFVEMVVPPARKPYAPPKLERLEEDDPRVVVMKNSLPTQEEPTS